MVMKTSKEMDKVFSTISWVIVVALIFSSISVWFAPPTGTGPIGGLLGVLGAQIFYSVLYSTEAAFLAFSKWKKRRRLRKNTLLVIYLTGFFTTTLTVLGVGWSVKFIDNFVFASCAAFCWLYWKFRTEYFDPEFTDDEWSCRDKPELD